MDSRPEPPTVRIDGDRIRRLREEKELTQLYVATVVGVTTDTVSRWENRRYQTVKRQNALKLAQALEVDLNDILEKEENRAVPANDAATTGQPSRGNQEAPPAAGPLAPATGGGLSRRQIIGGMAAVLIAMLILAGIRLSRQLAPVADMAAARFLPAHSAPNSPFPVKLVVAGQSEGPVSLIVKEELPPGVRIVAAIPPAKQNGRELRWLRKTGLPATFLYFCTIDPAVPMRGILRFSGTITPKGRRPITVQGPGNAIQVLPYHWADTNRDNSIDDEEILAVFDDFGALEGRAPATLDFERIEDIWAAGAYRWVAARKTFTPAE